LEGEVSEAKGGWQAYPDANDHHAKIPPTRPGRVIRLGAVCDLRPRDLDDAGSQRFSVSEFATLQDGRRVILHEERGFTVGLRSTGETDPGALVNYETADSVTRNVLNVVLPDDEDSEEDHPWEWLAELARTRGLDVTSEGLRGLPYEVVLTDRVTRWLRPT